MRSGIHFLLVCNNYCWHNIVLVCKLHNNIGEGAPTSEQLFFSCKTLSKWISATVLFFLRAWTCQGHFFFSCLSLVMAKTTLFLRTVSSYHKLSALLNWFKLFYWQLVQISMHRKYTWFLTKPVRKESNVPKLKRS